MGCVYFLKGAGNEVKIGFTENLKERVGSLKTGNPNLKVLFYIEDNSARGIENHFHYIFDEKRIYGEWFRLTDDDLSGIMSNYEIKEFDEESDNGNRRRLRPSKIYSCNLEVATVDIIQDYCDENRISFSKLMRDILNDFVQENNLY